MLTRLGITSKHSATGNLHSSQITTATAKSFPASCVFTSLSLVTASNSGDSSVSALKPCLNDGFFPNKFFFAASTSYNPTALHGPLQGELYVFMIMLHVNALQSVTIVTRNWVITTINLTPREILRCNEHASSKYEDNSCVININFYPELCSFSTRALFSLTCRI
jgi:hypothetical protein